MQIKARGARIVTLARRFGVTEVRRHERPVRCIAEAGVHNFGSSFDGCRSHEQHAPWLLPTRA